MWQINCCSPNLNIYLLKKIKYHLNFDTTLEFHVHNDQCSKYHQYIYKIKNENFFLIVTTLKYPTFKLSNYNDIFILPYIFSLLFLALVFFKEF
jgi:hypothetical protein